MRVDRREFAAIFVGGFVGAVARAGLIEAFPSQSGQWPWATFTVNAGGALLLGYFTTRLQERLPLSAYRRPLLGNLLHGRGQFRALEPLSVVKRSDGSGHLSVKWGS